MGSAAGKDVGNGKALNLGTLAVDGVAAVNYTLAGGSAAVDITQRQVSLTGVSAADRQYDGTRVATLSGGALSNLVAGEALGLSGMVGTFDNANAGNRGVTVTGTTLADGAGGLASNYVLTAQPTVANATIAQRQVTLTGMTATDRQYDGSTLASLTGGSIATGVVGEALNFSGATGQFSSANAGSQAVAVTGTTLADGVGGTGGLASNYVLTGQPLVANATIAQRQLTLTGMTAADRQYDGTRVAALSGGALNNLVAGEALAFNGATGTFASRNAGSQAVTVAGTTLADGAGGLASNYVLAGQPTVANATIAQRALTVTAAAQSKVYDGNTAASVTYGDNRITGDALSFTSSASFNTKDAGTGKAVAVSGIALGGADAGNYSANTVAASSANITRAPLSVTANNDTRLAGAAYSGGNGVVYSGLVGGETAAVLTGALTYGGSSQGARAAGTYAITPGGQAGSNYAITYNNGALNLTPASAAVMALGGSELSDAYTSALVSVTGAGKAPEREPSQGVRTTISQSCGVRMPEGFDTAECN